MPYSLPWVTLFRLMEFEGKVWNATNYPLPLGEGRVRVSGFAATETLTRRASARWLSRVGLSQKERPYFARAAACVKARLTHTGATERRYCSEAKMSPSTSLPRFSVT